LAWNAMMEYLEAKPWSLEVFKVIWLWIMIFIFFVDVTCWTDVSPLPVSPKGHFAMFSLASYYILHVLQLCTEINCPLWEIDETDEMRKHADLVQPNNSSVLSSRAWKTSQNDFDDSMKINTNWT
jgi:hypothetical protein